MTGNRVVLILPASEKKSAGKTPNTTLRRPRMDPLLYQTLFDSALRSQMAWRRKAWHLLESGKLILQKAADVRPAAEALLNREKKEFNAAETAVLEEFQLYDVGLFLVALAVENLLKGLWVGRNFDRIKNVKSQRQSLPELMTHKLGEVAKAAGMRLSSDEKGLLSDLSKMIEWYGRYTTPTKVGEYGRLFETGTPANRFMTGSTILTVELPFPGELDRFITRVLDELETISKEKSA